MNDYNPKYYPLLFTHVYKSALWGGSTISSFRNDISNPHEPIAESWELVDRSDSQSIVRNGSSKGLPIRELIEQDPLGIVGKGHEAEDPFPLLFKIIDAKKDLSLQVHPDENSSQLLDHAEAKSEMWYVLDHEENAEILKGLKDNVSIDKFISSLKGSELKRLLNSFKSENGDAFMIHGNTMHSIGGGNLIYEIQQNSNTTYRVSDWGRKSFDGKPRDLHIDQALTCLSHKKNFSEREVLPCIKQIYKGENFTLQHKNLATCSYFHVDELILEGELNVQKSTEAFQVIYSIDGHLKLYSNEFEVEIKRGNTCLIPAGLSKFSIASKEGSKFLKAKVA